MPHDPDRTPDPERVNVLLDAARVPAAAKGAAVAQAATALLTIVLGLQNMLVISWVGLWAILPWVLLAGGLGAGAVASAMYKARAWALTTGLVLAGILVVVTGLFFGLSVASGVLAPLGILAVGGAVAALIFQILAVKPTRKVLAVRAELRQLGYDLSF